VLGANTRLSDLCGYVAERGFRRRIRERLRRRLGVPLFDTDVTTHETAEQILESIINYCKRINDSRHQ
jgi:hypothetical protein